MSERDAQWAVAALADVRETWVCGAGWAFTARYDGLELLAYGDARDREGLGRDRPGLASAVLTRCRESLASPSAVPVVLDGIDLFGYPAAEVVDVLGLDVPGLDVPGLDVLGLDRYPGVGLSVALPGSYLSEVRISA
ncbi:hypothetical protein [Streptomyces inhibens]|uniref:hypothetical protein n=1 Tax=Streptomyces inhibens TaxID=2293571 RepID=UPI001EE6DEF0|nr:hypothetical protein [Streptomyces inhibens]UKY48303.1 hypothetical protein KI385_05480 [Streptomyces inhibens]